MRNFITILILVLLTSATVHAALYKWVDEKGNTHYSDSEPPQTATQQSVEKLPELNDYSHSAIQYDDTVSTGAKNKNSGRVIMYSTSWCGYCKKARRHFKKNGIAFQEYDIETSSSAHRRFKELGGNGVPLIVIGDKTMSGFSADRFDSLYKR